MAISSRQAVFCRPCIATSTFQYIKWNGGGGRSGKGPVRRTRNRTHDRSSRITAPDLNGLRPLIVSGPGRKHGPVIRQYHTAGQSDQHAPKTLASGPNIPGCRSQKAITLWEPQVSHQINVRERTVLQPLCTNPGTGPHSSASTPFRFAKCFLLLDEKRSSGIILYDVRPPFSYRSRCRRLANAVHARGKQNVLQGGYDENIPNTCSDEARCCHCCAGGGCVDRFYGCPTSSCGSERCWYDSGHRWSARWRQPSRPVNRTASTGLRGFWFGGNTYRHHLQRPPHGRCGCRWEQYC